MKTFLHKFIFDYACKGAMLMTVVLMAGCADFLAVGPPTTQMVRQTVFEDDATATAAMSGVFREMTSGINGSGLFSITFLTALSSDETIALPGAGADALEFHENNILPGNAHVSSLWSQSYALVYKANDVIEGVKNSTKLSENVRTRLEGEARFVRAFIHFHLINLFGEVPYILTTDYRINLSVKRTDRDQCYNLLIEDLTAAVNLLPQDYTSLNGERARPIKWAAAALLARVYLYAEQWEDARDNASAVISNNVLFALKPDLNEVFKKNSSEAIFQLLNGPGANYTNEGNIFLNTPNYCALQEGLVAAFLPEDLRYDNWIGSVSVTAGQFYHPTKYKEKAANGTGAEYSMVLRLAEQFLIRAEANAHLGELSASIEDVDVIRSRAGLPLLKDTKPEISQEDLLIEIHEQRRLELFTEWGHRWFDLRRTRTTDAILAPIKAGWEETDVLYPLPEKETIANPNLLPQNDGY